MGKREEFEGKQQAVMYQHTHNQIFQERKNPHCTDGLTSVSSVSRGTNSRRKVGRKKASNTVAAAFIPGVSEKTSTASPKRMPTTSTHCGSVRLKLQYQVDIQKWSGISCNMHIVQYQHLQQYQAYEPSYFMQIIN